MNLQVFPVMKKRILLVAAFVGALFCACVEIHDEGCRDIILSAYSADTEAFSWSPEDEVSLFRGEGGEGGWKLASITPEPAAAAEFKGDIPVKAIEDPEGGKYWAVYPYSKANGFDGSVLTTVVPAAQAAAASTFSEGQFVAIGCSDTLSMGFYHLCGGIKFTLEQPDVTEITLSGNAGEVLAGKVTVSFNDAGVPEAKDVVEGAKEIKLSCEGGFQPGVEYYLVTLPVVFEDGFTVDFGDGEPVAVKGPFEISRATFQPVEFKKAEEEESFVYEECDIEDPLVRRFLEEVDYTKDTDYTDSYILAYYDSNDQVWPTPVKLTWEGKAAYVELSTSSTFEDVTRIDDSDSPAEVYNLIPGVPYYYRVLDGDGKVMKRACMTPVGPVRMIKGLGRNVRDLGGWKADGGHIAYGKLYRGSRLDDIQKNPSWKEVLFNTLGASVDLDLRGLPKGTLVGSGEKNPWVAADPIEYCNIKLWHYFYPSAYKDQGPESGVSDGTSSDTYQYTIRKIINWLAEGRVVYFHCHGGSDRTGTLAFLIEALLGVSENDLSKDYELTCFSGESKRQRNCASGWFFAPMVRYLRTFAPGGTIKDQVTAWAKTQHSPDVAPLSDEEIAALRKYLIVNE